jgi:hypothetical protein
MMNVEQSYGVLGKDRWQEATRHDPGRHFLADNEVCDLCNVYRRLDAAVASYEAKVQDLAAETLRNSELLAAIDELTKDRTYLGSALAAIDELTAQRDKVVALHKRNTNIWNDGICLTDGEPWPCETARAYGVEE